MASVDEGAWDGAQAMSDAANSDDPAAAYAAICAGRKDGDPSLQSSWALPHHSHPGDGPNADGVRNALSRLPQTQGLTNVEAAGRHLEAHLADINGQRDDPAEIRTLDLGTFEVRNQSRRELGLFIVPWNTVIETPLGPEMFVPGAFKDVDPSRVRLRMDHQDPPTGRGIAIEERTDGAYMDFKVARTARGDEQLTLAVEGVSTGASIGFQEIPGGTSAEMVNGRRVRVHRKVNLPEVSTTWRPAYERAAVMYVRSEEPIEPAGDEPMAQTEVTPTTATTATPEPDPTPAPLPAVSNPAYEQMRSVLTGQEAILDRIEKIETRARQDIEFPKPSAPKRVQSGEWVQTALRILTGERVSDLQVRALSDLITTDNIGLVPNAVVQSELIGIIDPARPFLETTRELPLPDQGMTLVVPVINTRPTVGIQSTEKTDITSTTTSIGTTSFDAITIAGGGDISLQLLKRSSPSYLDLYLRLLAEAYAIEADTEAVATLLNSGVTPGSANLDPEDLEIGEAWTNAVAVSRLLRPDHIWMSTYAIQQFIDAKADTTNQPLYSNLAADITVANGARGLISGLIPVYVPALDGSGADVLIGPSRGFAWAEDGSYTLQVDVPSKAGRDVAIVSILWFAPLYPAAFTSYNIAS